MMIGSMLTMLILALGLMALALAAMILVAIWVYRDAKSRGLEAWVWVLVVVLVPSFIGLLLYFLVGRKEARRACPSCGRQVPERSTFCGWCGAQMPEESPAERKKSPGKGLLITGLVCIGLTIVLGFGSIFALAIAGGAFEDIDFMSVSTVYVENHSSNSWNVNFHYTNKTPDHSFRIEDDGPDTLYFEGKCGEGPLTLRVWQGEVERTYDLSGGGTVADSLDLSIFVPGKVQMELEHNRGEGKMVEFKAWWEKGAAPAVNPITAESAQYLADAEFLVETIESTHPAFALDAVPEAYETAKAALLKVAADPAATLADFAWAAQAYTTTLEDGHTRIDLFGGTPQKRVDLDWYADRERLLLTDGREVAKVGGLSVKELFAAVDRYVPAENQSARDKNHGDWAKLQSLLAYVGVQLSADYGSVTVTLADGAEQTVAFVLPKQERDTGIISAKELGDVLYVDFNQCVPGGEVDAVSARLAQAVKDGTKKFIIDVRGNGGGDSTACNQLLEALGMSAPNYGSYTRYSPLSRDQRGTKAAGEQRYAPSLNTAKANPAVELVVLTDENTFSSATMLAVMVRDGDLGTIIGRTSTNAPNSYGDILSYQMPDTGIGGSVSYKQWLRPDENADPKTVTPDLVTDIGEDSLQAALDFMK